LVCRSKLLTKKYNIKLIYCEGVKGNLWIERNQVISFGCDEDAAATALNAS
jgi:hypothetical protein